MRITNSMMTNQFLKNLNLNMGSMSKYQYQLATNKRMTKLSDDPTGIVKSMQARIKLYKIDQYERNIQSARNWLTQAEASTMELNQIITMAYENTMQAASDYMNPSDKQAIGELIGQLRDHVLNLGNTQMGDLYIFGGYNTIVKPFSVDMGTGRLLYNGKDVEDPANDAFFAQQTDQIVQFEIGQGMLSDVTMTGMQFMGMKDKNVYNILEDLYQKLMDPTSTAEDISPFITRLQDAQSESLATLADLGGRTNRLDLVFNRYEEDFINYSEMKSTVEDARQAEVIMNFKMAESVYLSALSAGSKIIQPTLLSYIN